ncbi:MAG: hypothetical protein ACP5NX_04015 [Candidatus Bilamarchaeaceae archaeon]
MRTILLGLLALFILFSGCIEETKKHLPGDQIPDKTADTPPSLPDDKQTGNDGEYGPKADPNSELPPPLPE